MSTKLLRVRSGGLKVVLEGYPTGFRYMCDLGKIIQTLAFTQIMALYICPIHMNPGIDPDHNHLDIMGDPWRTTLTHFE